MSLGLDILDAVRKGGLNNWATTTGRNNKEQAYTNHKREAEQAIDELYSSMYGGKFTANQLELRSGQSKDSVYSRLKTLMERGKVQRKSIKGVFQYWRIK